MITAKEEARRIVNVNWTFQIRTIKKPDWELAKQVARDIVNEKLKVISTGSYNETFYKEVKTEIEKL